MMNTSKPQKNRLKLGENIPQQPRLPRVVRPHEDRDRSQVVQLQVGRYGINLLPLMAFGPILRCQLYGKAWCANKGPPKVQCGIDLFLTEILGRREWRFRSLTNSRLPLGPASLSVWLDPPPAPAQVLRVDHLAQGLITLPYCPSIPATGGAFCCDRSPRWRCWGDPEPGAAPCPPSPPKTSCCS